MKIRFLLIGTSLSLIPQTVNAQCVATQDCATLGYTETSCSGGNGIKCPFGNKWACFKSESEFCNEYGFTLSCTGTNQMLRILHGTRIPNHVRLILPTALSVHCITATVLARKIIFPVRNCLVL